MGKVSNVIRKGRKAIKALDLLKVLQSEITHEASFPRFQVFKSLFIRLFVYLLLLI